MTQQVIRIEGPAILITGAPMEQPADETPMVDLGFKTPAGTRFDYVVEPEIVEPTVAFQVAGGNSHVCQVNVPIGKFEELPEGADTGNQSPEVRTALVFQPDGQDRYGRGVPSHTVNHEKENNPHNCVAQVNCWEGTFDELPT